MLKNHSQWVSAILDSTTQIFQSTFSSYRSSRVHCRCIRLRSESQSFRTSDRWYLICRSDCGMHVMCKPVLESSSRAWSYDSGFRLQQARYACLCWPLLRICCMVLASAGIPSALHSGQLRLVEGSIVTASIKDELPCVPHISFCKSTR